VQREASRGEHGQRIARLLDIADDVRREDRRRPGRTHVLHQHVQELTASERIEARERFVEQEDRRADRKRDRERHLGLLAAG